MASAAHQSPGAPAAAPARAGFFASAVPQPPAPIFHLTARFKADAHPRKLNLGVGAYRDDALKPVVFSAVRKAEAASCGGVSTQVQWLDVPASGGGTEDVLSFAAPRGVACIVALGA